MKTLYRKTLIAVALSALAGLAIAQSSAEHPTTPPPAPERQARAVERNLKTFDTLDFDVFSNQKWDRLHESHAKDIVVTWPDGHETRGIDRHIHQADADCGRQGDPADRKAVCHRHGDHRPLEERHDGP